ncbi:response regulator [Polaribacter sp. Hel1_85]|uniref:response regulator n=1 Tax=Polaribacter sp. Hel1_85 TaxID=1250005 RepID=UPI00052C370B|nr:response regulator [Polaribacter sp. Hel1_85]KGL63432.1 two-component system response regulator, CheY-like superfamily [Polaribacter sp. Hel1_85]
MNTPLLIGIIDDDEIYQFTLTRIISRYRITYKTLSFLDGEKAMEYLTDNILIEDNIPDVIFLDNNMPIMDGWQFIEEYEKMESKINKKVLIFMVSSSVDPKDIERANKTNQISDYFIKPVSIEDINGVFDNLEKFF